MSEIIVTEQNISRLTKRLKKSIKKQLSHDVSLSIVSLILAETLGVDSIHHLKQKLNQKPKNEVEEILEFIHNYFNKNNDTKMTAFYLNKDEMGLHLYIQGNTNTTMGKILALYFGNEVTNVSKHMEELQFNKKDKEFMINLLDKMYFNNIAENVYLSERIQEKLHIKKNQRAKYVFKENMYFKNISNYGYCHNLFAIIDDDFFDRKSLPNNFEVITSVNNRFVDFTNENVNFYENIEEALKELKNKQLLIEFKTPLVQVSNLYPNSEYKEQGLSSFYIYKHDNISTAHAMNEKISIRIDNISDYYYFYAKITNNINYFPINHKYISSIEKGVESNKIINDEADKIKLR